MKKNSKPLISAQVAQKIQHALCFASHPTINYLFGKFCSQEVHMGQILSDLVRSYTKAIVLNTIMNQGIDPDEASLGLPLPTDPIADCLEVSAAHNHIATILRISYLFGLYSGRAMSNSEFSMNFDLEVVSKTENLIKENTEQANNLAETALEEAAANIATEDPALEEDEPKVSEELEEELSSIVTQAASLLKKLEQYKHPGFTVTEITDPKSIAEALKFLREHDSTRDNDDLPEIE